LTKFDKLIGKQLDPEGKVRMATLGKGASHPDLAASMKARMVELSRMGLAHEVKRGVFASAPDWQARLRARTACRHPPQPVLQRARRQMVCEGDGRR
jgi:hypothetical protein